MPALRSSGEGRLVIKCDNCGRQLPTPYRWIEAGSRFCSTCRRMYRRGWEAGWTALIRNGVYATAEGMEDFCHIDMLAGLTAPQVAALVDQIAAEQRWRDGDEEAFGDEGGY
jgi:hypothetical protein